MLVAPTAATALAEDEVLVSRHIVNDLAGFNIAKQCAAGNKDDSIHTVCTVEFSACAISAVFSDEFALVTECQKGV